VYPTNWHISGWSVVVVVPVPVMIVVTVVVVVPVAVVVPVVGSAGGWLITRTPTRNANVTIVCI
jgi:hypothetical protein